MTRPGGTALAGFGGLATERSQCGSAFEFSRPRGRWHERARVADPKCSSYDEFGFAVAISGSTALIGAPGADNNKGAAYLLTLLPPAAAGSTSR
ncbi:MAG TPA: FG-GAP repeat protein [Streptosporangiaceae bacterium]|nr:FG-GAP repeat protein [Streptosporangiaceae bacterium]